MKIYIKDQKLNLEEIFTNDEVKFLKKSFPKINILIRAIPEISISNSKKHIINKPKLGQENSKNKIFVYKKQFYELILENIRKKYEKEGDNIMVKSLSCLIDDLSAEDNNNINNSKTMIIINNENISKNEKLNFNRSKQSSTISLTEKKINDISNEIISSNINLDKSKINKEDKTNLKKLKSPNNNYKNIYYYNIINSKKIINNNNFKKDDNKNKAKLTNQKYFINNEKPLYYIDYSMNFHNSTNKLNSSNLSYFNHKNTLINNYKNYASSIQIYNRTEQKEAGIKYILEKAFIQDVSAKNEQKNKTPIQIRKVNITDANVESLFNVKKFTFLNVNANSFNNIENQDFNIFELIKSVGRENILPVIGYYIFNRFGFYNILKYDKYENWCKKIAEGYIKANPYHTDLHAADITHTCLIYLKVGKVNKICKLSKNSKCALFLSCICHDYRHPGVNNNYLKETKNKIAIKYNDISILENMHIAETFKLINDPNNEYNIFQGLDNNTYKQFRKEMIACVLSTDMSFHNIYVEFLKKNLEKTKSSSENEDNKKEDYQNYLNILIHSADISNPTKPFEIYFQWAELVVKEFYEQGDKEKKLNMPCSCDRNKVTIYQSQLGFINYIEIPYFSLFVQVFENLKFYMDNLNSNKQKLLEMQEKDKKKTK